MLRRSVSYLDIQVNVDSSPCRPLPSVNPRQVSQDPAVQVHRCGIDCPVASTSLEATTGDAEKAISSASPPFGTTAVHTSVPQVGPIRDARRSSILQRLSAIRSRRISTYSLNDAFLSIALRVSIYPLVAVVTTSLYICES